MNRREFLTGCSLTAAAVLTGCKHPPTEDGIRKIGAAFGAATGLVLDQCDLDAKSRNAIIDIVNRGYTVVPAEGQTIFDAWKEVAKRHVEALVLDGTITATQGDLILSAFDLVLKGVALLIEKHPDIGTYGALTIAAIEGFCNGFLAVYKPIDANGVCTDCCEDCLIDVKAFKVLRKSAEARQVIVRSRAASGRIRVAPKK